MRLRANMPSRRRGRRPTRSLAAACRGCREIRASLSRRFVAKRLFWRCARLPHGSFARRARFLLFRHVPYLFIYALPKTALRALDERDGFDVVGVREHVHGLHRVHLEAELAKKRQVTDLRFRIARDVDHARRRQLHRGAQEFLA